MYIISGFLSLLTSVLMAIFYAVHGIKYAMATLAGKNCNVEMIPKLNNYFNFIENVKLFKTKHYQFSSAKQYNVPTQRDLCTTSHFKLTWQDFLPRIDQLFPNVLLCPYICKASLDEVYSFNK